MAEMASVAFNLEDQRFYFAAHLPTHLPRVRFAYLVSKRPLRIATDAPRSSTGKMTWYGRFCDFRDASDGGQRLDTRVRHFNNQACIVISGLFDQRSPQPKRLVKPLCVRRFKHLQTGEREALHPEHCCI
jgi:hypothetical protein